MAGADYSRTVGLPGLAGFDALLLGAALTLVGLGVVMVTSASITFADRELGEPLHFLLRQSAYLGVGFLAGVLCLAVPLRFWEEGSLLCLVAAFVLLVAVLVPGIGREVNGAVRWISAGPVNIQVSEPARLLIVVFLAGYVARRGKDLAASLEGFLKPMAIVGAACALLLAQPDFGAATVLLATALGMLFVGGVRLKYFLSLVVVAVGAMAALAFLSPYRLRRLTAFLDPWADPYDSGFQLTQSLIAIGRGELGGVGLGGSVQKLFYLPEAHTDFVFAVYAEEFGLIGVLLLIALYGILLWRMLAIASRAAAAGRPFVACLSFGLAIWLGAQAAVNIGVNMGLLPTKGLTLPLVSFGGSSLVVCCAAIGLVLRAHLETAAPDNRRARRRGGRS
jgi:cell division protein FtsW